MSAYFNKFIWFSGPFTSYFPTIQSCQPILPLSWGCKHFISTCNRKNIGSNSRKNSKICPLLTLASPLPVPSNFHHPEESSFIPKNVSSDLITKVMVAGTLNYYSCLFLYKSSYLLKRCYHQKYHSVASSAGNGWRCKFNLHQCEDNMGYSRSSGVFLSQPHEHFHYGRTIYPKIARQVSIIQT